jgi:hypothetical protein
MALINADVDNSRRDEVYLPVAKRQEMLIALHSPRLFDYSDD